MTVTYFLLIFVNTLILVGGQFLWKYGMLHNDFAFDSLWEIVRMFFSPFIFTGLVLYGVATILWLFILTRVPLSIAYPLQSITYVLAIIGSYFVFGEPITWSKVVGVLFILIGVSIIGLNAGTAPVAS